MLMGFSQTDIDNVYLLEPEVLKDERGNFQESFRRDKTQNHTGFDFKVEQANSSVSAKGVLRGFHFKRFPPGQAKFVTVNQGSIIDVVIDLRKHSPTFGLHQAFELSSSNNKSLLIGYGIGHAFISLEDNTRVSYFCDSVFEPELEYGINPLEASIDWKKLAAPFGVHDFIISAKDRQAPALNEAADLLFD